MNIHTGDMQRARLQSTGSFASTSDVFQTFFAYEKNLTSEDLGQVVKSLSELQKIVKTTENKLLLNSVTSKIANNFELVKNVHKYQYFEVKLIRLIVFILPSSSNLSSLSFKEFKIKKKFLI